MTRFTGRFEGVYVAIATPFAANGSLNLTHFEDHLEWLAKEKVHGFVPCGTTGEAPTLSRDEWMKVIAASVNVARKHNLKVIAGCGSNSTAQVVEMAKAAAEIGADGALVVTPYYNKPTARGILAHYRHIADNSPLPIVLYHVPGRTNVTMSAETITELLKHPNIVGIKEASANQSLWLALSKANNLREKSLMAGDDDAFVVIKSLGGSGIISATANVIPDLFVKMHELTDKGEMQAAWDLQRRALPVINAMFVETNPTPVKYALKLLRGYENVVRLPLVSVVEESENKIASALKETGYL